MRLLVTGAGFSKCWGYPLTWEIREKLRILLAQEPPEDRRGRSAEFIIELPDALEKSEAEGKPSDYEELLTALRDAATMDDPSVWLEMGVDPDDLQIPDPEYHYRQLVWGLGVVLSWGGWGKPPEAYFSQRARGVPEAYSRFLYEFGPFNGIVTLNYDIIPKEIVGENRVDYGIDPDNLLEVVGFEREEVPTRFGSQFVNEVETAPRMSFPDEIPVLKVHGSQNMAFCPGCQRALVFPKRLPPDKAPAEQFAWLATAAYRCCVHCVEPDRSSPPNTQGKMRPLMIPPVEEKEELPAWEILAEVRDRALELASQADEAVIVGTSVRPTDEIILDIVDEIEGADITYIGGADGRERLEARVGQVENPRARLTAAPELCETVGEGPRMLKYHFDPPGDEPDSGQEEPAGYLGPTSPGEWRDLPSLEVPGVHYLTKAAYLAVPEDVVTRLGLETEALEPYDDGFVLPSAVVLKEDGTKQVVRLPLDLGDWVLGRVGRVELGFREIPSRVRFQETDDGTEATVLGM